MEEVKPKKKKSKQLGKAVRFLLPTNKVHATRIFITGRSGSGKTTLAVKIMTDYLLSRVHRFIVICPSFFTQKTFSNIVQFAAPEDIYIERPTEATFEKIRADIQKDLEETPETRFLLFIDDVSSDFSTNIGRKGAFASLSTEAPHINLSILCLFQQAKTCSAAFRNNADNIIMFPPADRAALDVFRDEFNPYVYDKQKAKEFETIVTEIWDQGDFIFIHRPARMQVISFKNFDSEIRL